MPIKKRGGHRRGAARTAAEREYTPPVRSPVNKDVTTTRPVTDAMLRNPDPGDWLMFRRNYEGQSYSPLDRINEKNVGNLGLAVGLDPSPELLSVARGLAQEAGLGDRVEFHEGDALRLPFPDRSFDVVLCVTVLSHVPQGEAAIPELVRVLRSGGRLGVFDLDTDMTAFTHPDRALTSRQLQSVCHADGSLLGLD